MLHHWSSINGIKVQYCTLIEEAEKRQLSGVSNSEYRVETQLIAEGSKHDNEATEQD